MSTAAAVLGCWEFQHPSSNSWVPFTSANNDKIQLATDAGRQSVSLSADVEVDLVNLRLSLTNEATPRVCNIRRVGSKRPADTNLPLSRFAQERRQNERNALIKIEDLMRAAGGASDTTCARNNQVKALHQLGESLSQLERQTLLAKPTEDLMTLITTAAELIQDSQSEDAKAAASALVYTLCMVPRLRTLMEHSSVLHKLVKGLVLFVGGTTACGRTRHAVFALQTLTSQEPGRTCLHDFRSSAEFRRRKR